MLMKSFFAIAIGCMLSISATAAQEAIPLGKAIGEGVDQRVDKRVDERLAQRQEAAPKANSSVPKAGDYANKSERYAQYLAQCASGGMNASLRDETAVRFDKMSAEQFKQQLTMCPRAVQDRQVTIQAQAAARTPGVVMDHDQPQYGPGEDDEAVAQPVSYSGPGYYGQPRPGYGRPAPQQYRSFDNVARESLKVRSNGQDFNLRNIGGNTRSCQPPRQLVRSNRCISIPNGGVRCRFDCR